MTEGTHRGPARSLAVLLSLSFFSSLFLSLSLSLFFSLMCVCVFLFLCVTWLIHEWHDAFTCNMTRSLLTRLVHTWRDSIMTPGLLPSISLSHSLTHSLTLPLSLSLSLSFSLSLTHTRTHTLTHSLSLYPADPRRQNRSRRRHQQQHHQKSLCDIQEQNKPFCRQVCPFFPFLSDSPRPSVRHRIARRQRVEGRRVTAHWGDHTSNIWIFRSNSFPVRSFECRALRLLTWQKNWRFGDSPENREKKIENLGTPLKTCVICTETPLKIRLKFWQS